MMLKDARIIFNSKQRNNEETENKYAKDIEIY